MATFRWLELKYKNYVMSAVDLATIGTILACVHSIAIKHNLNLNDFDQGFRISICSLFLYSDSDDLFTHPAKMATDAVTCQQGKGKPPSHIYKCVRLYYIGMSCKKLDIDAYMYAFSFAHYNAVQCSV